MNFIAYKITCSATGKCYIGITTQTLLRRWSQHVSQSKNYKTKLAMAIRKYGRDSFTVEHIASAGSIEKLRDLEIQLIAQEDTLKQGLNLTIGGDGAFGLHHSDESKKKMSMAQLEIAKRPETKDRRAQAQKKVWSQKTTDEIEIHRQRMKKTIIHYYATAPKRIKKQKIEKPHLGKGYNMIIKTHCPQGHPYAGENLFIDNRGRRNCRICRRTKRNLSRDTRRAENRASDGGKAY